MINLFKLELRRALFNRNFIISIVISFIMIFIGLKEPLQFKSEYTYIEAWMRGISMGKGMIVLFAPILSSIVYSISLAEEKKNNYLQYIYIRTNSRRYLYIKGIINALIGGLSIFIPAIILVLIVVLKFESPEVLGVYAINISNDPLSWLIDDYGILYLFLQCLWIFFQGMIWATISFAISLLSNKFISVIMIPFFYYIGANFLFAMINLEIYTPPSSFAPYLVSNSTLGSMLSQPLIIVATIFAIVLFYKRFEDEYYL